MNDFPGTIDADDLLLRPIEDGDIPMIVRHLGDPETARWMAAVKHPFGQVEAEEILAIGKDPDRRLRVLAKEGSMVGCLCLVPDVWFWLDAASRGQGLMARAMQAAITAHFATMSPPLLATCREDNHPSQGLLSALGFSRRPTGRRMFFQSEGRACPCHDYVMTSEQWLQLHPPVRQIGPVTLRPATQKDAPTLVMMLPRGDRLGIWPGPEALGRFIEQHRCRIPGQGLFVVEDGNRRVMGMVLLRDPTDSAFRFLTPEDAARYAQDLETALRGSGS